MQVIGNKKDDSAYPGGVNFEFFTRTATCAASTPMNE
jgi:hypothetical protein